MTIEEKFREAATAAHVEIDKHLKIANKALAAAEKISGETGIPFHSQITPISQSYFPPSFRTKWEEALEKEFEAKVPKSKWGPEEEIGGLLDDFGVWKGEYQEEGWAHSAVCS